MADLEDLAFDLGKATKELLPKARVIVQKTANDIKRDAKIYVPVDTGNLRNSISYETHENPTSVTGDIGPTANYGGYVELGTSRMAPRPYMGPAGDRHRSGFEAAMSKMIEGLL